MKDYRHAALRLGLRSLGIFGVAYLGAVEGVIPAIVGILIVASIGYDAYYDGYYDGVESVGGENAD